MVAGLYLILGQGDELVYVHACPREGSTLVAGREGAVLLVCVSHHVCIYHTSREHGLH